MINLRDQPYTGLDQIADRKKIITSSDAQGTMSFHWLQVILGTDNLSKPKRIPPMYHSITSYFEK